MSADDYAPAEEPRERMASHVLVERIDAETLSLFRQGVRATRRKSYVEGSALRYAANEVRDAIGLPTLNYWAER